MSLSLQIAARVPRRIVGCYDISAKRMTQFSRARVASTRTRVACADFEDELFREVAAAIIACHGLDRPIERSSGRKDAKRLVI